MPVTPDIGLSLPVTTITIGDMAKSGRPSTGKTMVQCRIDPTNLGKLRELAKQFSPANISTSQMIDIAVAEYVERHTGKKRER